MFGRILPLVVATAMVSVLGACSPQEDRGGGGGALTTQERAAADNRAQRAGDNTGNQMRANMTNDLTTEGRDFTEAYARVPWIHANLAAGDWERALDDVQFVNKQLDDLNRDNDVSKDIKARLMVSKPLVATLSQQIQKHDQAAMGTTKRLLDSFASTMGQPIVLAWLGDRTRGGGAGTGGTMHYPKDKDRK